MEAGRVVAMGVQGLAGTNGDEMTDLVFDLSGHEDLAYEAKAQLIRQRREVLSVGQYVKWAEDAEAQDNPLGAILYHVDAWLLGLPDRPQPIEVGDTVSLGHKDAKPCKVIATHDGWLWVQYPEGALVSWLADGLTLVAKGTPK